MKYRGVCFSSHIHIIYIHIYSNMWMLGSIRPSMLIWYPSFVQVLLHCHGNATDIGSTAKLSVLKLSGLCVWKFADIRFIWVCLKVGDFQDTPKTTISLWNMISKWDFGVPMGTRFSDWLVGDTSFFSAFSKMIRELWVSEDDDGSILRTRQSAGHWGETPVKQFLSSWFFQGQDLKGFRMVRIWVQHHQHPLCTSQSGVLKGLQFWSTSQVSLFLLHHGCESYKIKQDKTSYNIEVMDVESFFNLLTANVYNVLVIRCCAWLVRTGIQGISSSMGLLWILATVIPSLSQAWQRKIVADFHDSFIYWTCLSTRGIQRVSPILLRTTK